MSCDDFRESLAASALGISPEDGVEKSGDLEAHLASCLACREKRLALDAARRSLHGLVAARASAPLSPDVRAKVLAGIGEREARRASWKRPVLGLAFLAAASVAVFFVPTAPSPLPAPPLQHLDDEDAMHRDASGKLPLEWRTVTVAPVASTSEGLAATLAAVDASRPDFLDQLELKNAITHEEKVLLLERIEAAPVTSTRLALVAEEITKLRVERAKEAPRVGTACK